MTKQKYNHLLFLFVGILLPIIFGLLTWDKLLSFLELESGNLTIYRIVIVFSLPNILLLIQVLLLMFKRKEISLKNYWIILLSILFVNGIIYKLAFGKGFDLLVIIPLLIGIIFIIVSSLTSNKLVIKTIWMKSNQNNYLNTINFSKKSYLIGGVLTIFFAIFPVELMIMGMMLSIVFSLTIPIIYSYCIYQKDLKSSQISQLVTNKTSHVFIMIIIPLIMVITSICSTLPFYTGRITIHYDDDSFKLNTSYYLQETVKYDDLDIFSKYIRYDLRFELDVGEKISGINSSKLQVGKYRNKEYGEYQLYAYTESYIYVVLNRDSIYLLIGFNNTSDFNKFEENLTSHVKNGPM